MPIRAVLFDLDDTLYEERHFFRSGFAAVGTALADRGIGVADSTQALLERFHLEESREGVLQKLSAVLPFPAEWIPELVETIRSHSPAIQLADDAMASLPNLRTRFKLGCVTDGWAAVQRRKLAALGVEPMLDAVVVADDAGRERWKPHPLPFITCCHLLGVEPSDAVYVGDNPERDIAGARNAGLHPVRIRRPGAYFAATAIDPMGIEPVAEITTLLELEPLLLSL